MLEKAGRLSNAGIKPDFSANLGVYDRNFVDRNAEKVKSKQGKSQALNAQRLTMGI